MTRSGVIAGTPQYMSPEQARGEPIDVRSDLFSLGSLLYAMCTGHSPFRAETSFGVIHRITHDKPRRISEVNPDIPQWLEGILMNLLSKQAELRFQSAKEVAKLLEGCLSHTQHPDTTPLPKPVLELSTKPIQQRRWFRFLAAGCLLPILLFATVLIVLEWNKGTLRIESESDDVPIRILQGENCVEELTVSKSGKSIRIAAGNYEVEIGGPIDGLTLDDNEVTLKRGGKDVVRIVRSDVDEVAAVDQTSTKVYDVSEFVDTELSFSRATQVNTLIAILQQVIESDDPIEYWASFHNIVVRSTNTTHDRITDTLNQLRFCKQQIQGTMSLNARIERLQAELSDVPDADRASKQSRFLQDKIDVAMVARSQQTRAIEFSLAKLQVDQPNTETADGELNRIVNSPAHKLTSDNLGKIIKALHRYHDVHKQLPMAAIPGKDGRGGAAHSWRVELLPHQELYDRYHFDETWDSEHNRSLLSQMPDVYRSPLDSPDSVHASFFAVTSSLKQIELPQPSTDSGSGAELVDGEANSFSSTSGGGFFAEAEKTLPESLQTSRPSGTTMFWKFGNTRFHNVTDGTSHTIALVEAKREIPWTQPNDIEYSHDKPLPVLGGWFEAGWHTAFVDGHVRFFPRSQNEQALRSLLTIDDGQSVE